MAVKYVPYENGSLQEWVPEDYPNLWRPSAEWRENKPFRARLLYKGYERGRSAARAVWEDDQGHTFPMFLSDLDYVLSNGLVTPIPGGQGSYIEGEWTVAKKGANYGLQWIGY